MSIRMLIPLAVFALVASCTSAEDSYLDERHFGGVDQLDPVVGIDSDLGDIVMVREVAPSAGLGAVGRVSSAAIDGVNSLLIVGDALSCSLKRYSLVSGTFVDSLARCGEGPNELRMVGTMFPTNEGVLVADYGARAVVEIRQDSVSRARRALPAIMNGSWMYRILDVDSAGLLALWAPVSQQTDTGSPPAVVMSVSNDGSLRAEAIRAPAITARNPGYTSGHGGCSAVAVDGHRYTVVASSWAHEAIVLRGTDLQPVARALTTVAWDSIRQAEDDRGPSSPFARTSAACGDETFAILRESKKGADSTAMSRLEIRDYSGRMTAAKGWRLRQHESGVLPIALKGDRLFAVVDDSAGYPLIAEFLVRTATGGAQ